MYSLILSYNSQEHIWLFVNRVRPFFGTKRNAKRSHFPPLERKEYIFNLQIINSLKFFFSFRSEMRNAHIFPRLEWKRMRTVHPRLQISGHRPFRAGSVCLSSAVFRSCWGWAGWCLRFAWLPPRLWPPPTASAEKNDDFKCRLHKKLLGL